MRRLYLVFGLVWFLAACTPPASPTGASAPTLVSATALPPTVARPTATPPATARPEPSAGPTLAIPTATAVPENTPTAPPTERAFPPAPGGLRQIIGGLQRPVFLTQPADDTQRLFIVEQAGLILILHDGALLREPFLDLRARVNSRGNEQGLLGLAFHPQYRENGRFFVYYTDDAGAVIVARYTVSATDPNRADPASATPLLHIDHPFSNHNGGHLTFGPDGYLYLGIGDGGSAGDPRGYAQNLGALLGKLLRIDVNADAYAIPADNPFRERPGARPEIWAYGLRNPWRFSFDRVTGDLYIGDVGQGTYEEINLQPAGDSGGENYGWNFMEGLHPYKGTAPDGLTLPVAEYPHAEGGCSVTGGYVYRGTLAPQLTGLYIFGDYCSGLVWALNRTPDGWQRALLLNTSLNISSFAEDLAGELYVLDLAKGAIYIWEAAPTGTAPASLNGQ